jgi:hypothetical protein
VDQTLIQVDGDTATLRRSCILGCKLSVPKTPREGHPHSFRLDLVEPDNGGVAKYIISV